MYSPMAMLKLPAIRPAMPARTTVWASPDDAPATPMIRLTLATRPSVAPNTEGRRMLEPRVSWRLVGAASRSRNLDRMARTTARGARVFVTGIVSHAEANKHLRAHDRVVVSVSGSCGLPAAVTLGERRLRLGLVRRRSRG